MAVAPQSLVVALWVKYPGLCETSCISPPHRACQAPWTRWSFQNSHSRFVEGCHTVSCSSVPSEGTASAGNGTASHEACRSGPQVSRVTRVVLSSAGTRYTGVL